MPTDELQIGQRWRHVKRGSTYKIRYLATMQDSGCGPPGVWTRDMEPVVVYQSEQDQSVWVRPVGEFLDGRFVKEVSCG